MSWEDYEGLRKARSAFPNNKIQFIKGIREFVSENSYLVSGTGLINLGLKESKYFADFIFDLHDAVSEHEASKYEEEAAYLEDKIFDLNNKVCDLTADQANKQEVADRISRLKSIIVTVDDAIHSMDFSADEQERNYLIILREDLMQEVARVAFEYFE